ncbi:hypothetical protein Hanom_Chr16g01464381 [Helianthus anomalus]
MYKKKRIGLNIIDNPDNCIAYRFKSNSSVLLDLPLRRIGASTYSPDFTFRSRIFFLSPMVPSELDIVDNGELWFMFTDEESLSSCIKSNTVNVDIL